MTWPVDDLTTVHLDAGTDDPSRASAELYRLLVRLNEMIQAPAIANGVCDLDTNTKVPMSRLITGANGLATLDGAARVPASQIPTGAGAPILLDSAGRIPTAKEPFIALATPEVITTTPTAGSWQTVANATLSGAAAKAALLKIEQRGTTTSRAYSDVHLRPTGSGLAQDDSTVHASVFTNSDGGYTAPGARITYAILPLDSSSRFDYFWYQSTGWTSPSCVICLEGYWV